MLADNIGVDVPKIHLRALPNHIFEAGCIQHRPRPDNLVGRKTRKLVGDIGEDIHRIGDDQQNSIVMAVFRDLLNDIFEDSRIPLQKRDSRLAGLLICSGGDDDDVGTADLLIVTGDNGHRRDK